MSPSLIDRSSDLKRLRDEGYAIEIKASHLLVHDVPYLDNQGRVQIGTLVAPLSLTGGIAAPPSSHVMHFIGQDPCSADGRPIEAIKHVVRNQTLGSGIIVNRSFSNKPQGGYKDNYQKFTTYANILSHQAMEVDPSVTARTYRLIRPEEEEGPFCYADTNSSRNGTFVLFEKFQDQRIGIVGLGGTGAYILDSVAKTPVAQIHLFDDDEFNAHNAFRIPGAVSLEQVNEKIKKVDLLGRSYGQLHRSIHTHQCRITPTSLSMLEGLTFVFIAIDNGKYKQVIFDYLIESNIPFVDVGMGIHWNPTRNRLMGAVRATLGDPENFQHLNEVVSFGDAKDNLYADNIQIAELNSLNASLAVIKWKLYLGVYQSDGLTYHTIFNVDDTNTFNEY